MRRLLPLMILALAGCDQFLEDAFPRDRLVFDVEGKTYALETQFDPIEYAYFTQVTAAELGPGLTIKDATVVQDLVLNKMGPRFCEGEKMVLSEFNQENLPGGGNVVFLQSRGTYQFVTRCPFTAFDELPEIGLPDLTSVL